MENMLHDDKTHMENMLQEENMLHDDEFQVQDLSTEKKYFTQFFNIIYEIPSLKSHDRDVYLYLKRVCGEGGQAWQTHKMMAKKLGMSVRKLIYCLTKLAEPFEELNGKSLIITTRRQDPQTKQKFTSIHTITDLMEENFKIFSTPRTTCIPPCARHAQGCAPRAHIEEETYKKKPETKSTPPPKRGKPPPHASRSSPQSPSLLGVYKNVILSEKKYEYFRKKYTHTVLKTLIKEVSQWKYSEELPPDQKDHVLIEKFHSNQERWAETDRKASEKRLKTSHDLTKIIYQKNKDLIQKKGFKWYAHVDHVEIAHPEDNNGFHLKYEDPNFEEKLMEALKKRRIIKP